MLKEGINIRWHSQKLKVVGDEAGSWGNREKSSRSNSTGRRDLSVQYDYLHVWGHLEEGQGRYWTPRHG